MSLIVAGTVVGIYAIIGNYLQGTISKSCIWLVSVMLLFISNIPIPDVFPHIYDASFVSVTQPWHNSTYILMSFFGIWVLYYYFRIIKSVKSCEKIALKDTVIFWIILSLCNYSKPNFF